MSKYRVYINEEYAYSSDRIRLTDRNRDSGNHSLHAYWHHRRTWYVWSFSRQTWTQSSVDTIPDKIKLQELLLS